MTCDDFQIALDQRQAGVPSAIAAADVDAHVATCATCTAYVSLSEKVRMSMMSTLSRSPAPPDAAKILARITDLRRNIARSVALVPILVGIVMLGSFISMRGFSLRALIVSLVSVGVGGIVAYGFLALVMKRRMAELAALERTSGHTLVAGLRAELDRRIRNERQAWWFLPLLLVGFHLAFVGLAAPPLPYLVLDVCYLAIPLPISIVRYRRLVRERAVLGA